MIKKHFAEICFAHIKLFGKMGNGKTMVCEIVVNVGNEVFHFRIQIVSAFCSGILLNKRKNFVKQAFYLVFITGLLFKGSIIHLGKKLFVLMGKSRSENKNVIRKGNIRIEMNYI